MIRPLGNVIQITLVIVESIERKADVARVRRH